MVNFQGKLVLAPMVRAGELPTRLLALKHGADLVWGPEIIDKKLVTCDRVVNEKLGTVDFLSRGKTRVPGLTNLVFRTFPEMESSKVIFQMGTANPEIAVEAAKVVIQDVSGIDINAGCPKHFSIHAGMGAALLKTPDLLVSILTNLVEKVGKPNNKPISVKIRLLPEEKETLNLVDRLLQTGISNLTVHCRTQLMRNREAPIRDYVDKIKIKCDEYNVPLIINGDVKDREDYNRIREIYGDIGCMIATTAEINPTVFNIKPLEWQEVAKEFLEIAYKFDGHFSNVKYMLTKIIPGKESLYSKVCQSKCYKDVFELLGMEYDGKDELEQNNSFGLKQVKQKQAPKPKETKKHEAGAETGENETQKHALAAETGENETQKHALAAETGESETKKHALAAETGDSPAKKQKNVEKLEAQATNC